MNRKFELAIEHTHDNTAIIYISLTEIVPLVNSVYKLLDIANAKEYFMYSLGSVVNSSLIKPIDDKQDINYLDEVCYNLFNNYRILAKYEDSDVNKILSTLTVIIEHIRKKTFSITNEDSYRSVYQNPIDGGNVYVVSEIDLYIQPKIVLKYYNYKGHVL